MNELEKIVEYFAKKELLNQKRKKKPAYIKPSSVKELERFNFERKRLKHPDNPYPVKTIFRDDSSNGLTRCIISWLELHGYFAGRTNVTGIYNQKLGKYIHPGSRKGMADVTAVVNGRHVSIEIKSGRDRMRPDQLKVKSEIEAAGGCYLIVSSFDDFLNKILLITNKLHEHERKG